LKNVQTLLFAGLAGALVLFALPVPVHAEGPQPASPAFTIGPKPAWFVTAGSRAAPVSRTMVAATSAASSRSCA